MLYGWIWLLQNLYLYIYILRYKKKTVMLTKPNHNLSSFNEFVCTHALVYEYNLSSNFQNCLWRNFPVMFSSLWDNFFKKPKWYAFLLRFIWSIMVMIISEKITCGLYIFSTMIDPFKKNFSLFETVIWLRYQDLIYLFYMFTLVHMGYEGSNHGWKKIICQAANLGYVFCLQCSLSSFSHKKPKKAFDFLTMSTGFGTLDT